MFEKQGDTLMTRRCSSSGNSRCSSRMAASARPLQGSMLLLETRASGSDRGGCPPPRANDTSGPCTVRAPIRVSTATCGGSASAQTLRRRRRWNTVLNGLCTRAESLDALPASIARDVRIPTALVGSCEQSPDRSGSNAVHRFGSHVGRLPHGSLGLHVTHAECRRKACNSRCALL